jgi:hypothetical protein
VLKAPGTGTFSSVSQSVTSRDSGTVRLTADVSQPWTDQADWRALGYVEQSGRTRGGYDKQAGVGLLGTGTLRLGPFSGSLTLHAERRRETPAPAAQGGRTPVDGVFVELPPTRDIQVPANPADRQLFTSNTAHLNLRWIVSPQWSLSVNTMAESFQGHLRRHQSYTPPLQDRITQSSGLSTQWGLIGELTDGPLKHRLLFGLDASHWRADTHGVDFLNGAGPIRIDISESKTAVLLQDELSVGPLRLRLAVQHARTPSHHEIFRDNTTAEINETMDFLPVSGTNWDVGMLYQLRPNVAAYVGAQQATEASLVLPGQNNEGLSIPPSATRQVQAGLKLGSTNRLLSATLEVFRIRQSAFKLFKFSNLVVPGRSSDGLEFELTGRPVPYADLSLGFSYLRTLDKVMVGGLLVDAMASQIPRRSLYLLARIRLGDWLGHDNLLGVAFHAASTTLIGYPYYPTAEAAPRGLPGGGQMDLSWQGLFGAWTVKGAMVNVFDQRLFGTAADTRFIPLQPGRSISLTASYSH